MKMRGTQFFSEQKDVFTTYLNRTNQKRLVVHEIAKVISNLFDPQKKIRILCIGGGTGEADLEVARLLPKYFFEMENIDPSKQMCSDFFQKAQNLKNVRIEKNQCLNFQDDKTLVSKANLILSINSIYFLKGWQVVNNKNPLLKIYRALKENGIAVIVLRSDQSDHFLVRNLAGTGHTYGAKVRVILSKLEIPHYWETIESAIDISDLFHNNQFEPNKMGIQLLEFLSGGEWKIFSKTRQDKIVELLQVLKIKMGRKSFIKSAYEIIWIRKTSKVRVPLKDSFLTVKTIKIAQRVKPLIKSVPNFPIKGIMFRDTSILLQNPEIFSEVIDYAVNIYKNLDIDYIVAKDMQGVLWAGALAKQLGIGIIPMFRKDVVPPVLTTSYSHEYNPDRVLNLQKNTIKNGNKLLIIDYMIATGATVLNMGKLIEHLGGKVVGVFSLMELEYLKPRNILPNYRIHTIIKYKNGD